MLWTVSIAQTFVLVLNWTAAVVPSRFRGRRGAAVRDPPVCVATSAGNNGQVQLWQFLLEMLTDKQFQEVIHWVGDHGEFKLNNPEVVAQLWGQRKNKPTMNYEKLSRALRYYYDGDMIAKVRRAGMGVTRREGREGHGRKGEVDGDGRDVQGGERGTWSQRWGGRGWAWRAGREERDMVAKVRRAGMDVTRREGREGHNRKGEAGGDGRDTQGRGERDMIAKVRRAGMGVTRREGREGHGRKGEAGGDGRDVQGGERGTWSQRWGGQGWAWRTGRGEGGEGGMIVKVRRRWWSWQIIQ